jgi:hypothetical protein
MQPRYAQLHLRRWDDEMVWAHDAIADNIVWGNADNSVWGADGAGFAWWVGSAEDDNIVWGNDESDSQNATDNIVWGNGELRTVWVSDVVEGFWWGNAQKR